VTPSITERQRVADSRIVLKTQSLRKLSNRLEDKTLKLGSMATPILHERHSNMGRRGRKTKEKQYKRVAIKLWRRPENGKRGIQIP
jgi:hypothetical protein